MEPVCDPADTDYAVYEGTLGAFTRHTDVLCSTAGVTSAMLNPAGGDTYYPVVPTN